MVGGRDAVDFKLILCSVDSLDPWRIHQSDMNSRASPDAQIALFLPFAVDL